MDNEGQTSARLFLVTSPNDMRFLDPNNPLCSGGPARIDTGIIGHPEAGNLGVLTIRTPSTTVTVLLDADDLRNWAQYIENLADALDVGGGTRLAAATPQDVAVLETVQRRSRGLVWRYAHAPAARSP